MARVRIVKLPKALEGAETVDPGLVGTNGNPQFSFDKKLQSGKIAQQPTEVRNTLQPVDREDANLEAEKGETAVINVDGMPAHFKIAGKRHSQGGTPLNLPDNSFIFSDTAKMKIKDPHVLSQFGMAPKKGGYTPADIAKKYDINKYRKVLADANSEDIDRKTAEMMIANYNLKLAKLALAQESIKGFPQGIPVMAMPYIESMEIDPSTFLPDQAQGQLEQGTEPDAEMGTMKFGGLPKAQVGIGFNNDPALEKKWKEDPEIGTSYDKYVAALKSGNADQMKAVATELNNKDVPGFQWWPGSGQNKLTDFSQILEEEAEKIRLKNSPKVLTENQHNAANDRELRKKASDAYAKVMALRDLAKQKKDVNAAYNYDLELDKLRNLHPDYKDAHFWRKEKNRKDAKNVPYTGEPIPATETIFYSKEEGNEINTIYDTYYPKTKAPVKTTATTKQVTATKPLTDTIISKSDLAKLSDKDVARLIAERTAGRKITYKEDGGELPIAQNGDVDPLLNEQKKRANKNTKSSISPIRLTPEEEEARRQRALSAPETFVSDADYEELAKLYKAAQDSSGGNPNKVTNETKAFQKRYHELLPDEARRIIASDHKLTTKGEKDLKSGTRRDPYNLEDNYDGMFGRRTEQYWQAVKKAPPVIDKKLPPGSVAAPVVGDKKAFQRNTPIVGDPKPYAPWWLQDIVKTSGAAADLLRVKKYNPWQATPEVKLPDATFYDPTRELAANTEQANLASQFHQAFTGPKSGAISGVQGKALANAADIMAKYNNMNVQIANQLSQENTGIMNQASQNKANLDTQLFDKYTIANQQFDNSKNMARQNLRQSYIDAITNRAKTQALNTLYPNFYTNPVTGGFVNKTGYASINPTKPGSDPIESMWEKAKIMNPNDPQSMFKILMGQKGTQADDGTPDQAYLRSQGFPG